LIAILIALGGVIAYVGDWIGRRVGRQRLTLFGLRPKHTSVMIAVITGVMVVGTTLAALIIVDNDFREMLIDYGSVKSELVATQGTLSSTQGKLREIEDQLGAKLRELDEKQETIDRLEAAVEPLEQRIEDLNDEIAAKTATNAELQKTNDQLGRRVEELSNTVAEKEQALGQAEARLATAEVRLSEVEQSLAQTSAELQETQKDLSQARRDLEQARKDKDAALEDLNEARVQLRAAKDDLADAEAELGRVRKDLDSVRLELDDKKIQLQDAMAQIDDLVAKRDALARERDDLARQKAYLEAERDRLVAERDRLVAERDELSSDKIALTGEVEALRTEVGSLKSQVSDLGTDVSRLTTERDNLMKDISALTEDLSELRKTHEAAQAAFGLQYDMLVGSYNLLRQGAAQGRILGVRGDLIDNWIIAPGDVEALTQHLAELAKAVDSRWGKDFEVDQSGLRSAQEAVRNAKERTLVRITLAENVYEDEQLTTVVRVNIQVRSRTLLFEKNEIIAYSESPIDPLFGDTFQILGVLSEIGEAARQKAIQKGMYVFQDGTVGVDVRDSMNAAVRRISQLLEPVRLYMVADEDIYNTDGPIDWSFGFMLESEWARVEPYLR
jgi:uncharacterized protein (DUF3084 family)